MDALFVEGCQVNNNCINVRKADKFDLQDCKEAVARINSVVQWSHDDEKIFTVLEERPRFCYLATLENKIIGYVILREGGEDRHLHVSWLATDVLKKGVGTELMHKVVNRNKKLGNRILTLHHRDNEKLLRFYNKIAEVENLRFSRETDATGFKLTYEM